MTVSSQASEATQSATTASLNTLRRKQALQAQGVLHNSFWAALDKAGRKRLMSLGRWKVYAGPQDAIYRRGQTSSYAFVLLGGHVKAVRDTASRHPTMLALHHPGQILGDDQALQESGTPVRPITMQPLYEAYGLVIEGDRFRSFLEEHPTAWSALARELRTRLNESEARLGQHTAESANRRLAKALVSLIDYPLAMAGALSPIAFPLTQAELASWIGASRETVERILRDWRNRGIVMTGYRTISVLHMDALIRISGMRRPQLSSPPPVVGLTQASSRADRTLLLR